MRFSMNDSRYPPLFPWLIGAALADWLITRTLTRLAIFVPKTPAMITGYQVMGQVGQIASSLAAVLVLVGLAWIAWHEWRERGARWLPLLLGARVGMGLLFLVMPPSGWLAVGNHVLALLVLVLLVGSLLPNGPGRTGDLLPRLVVLLPVAALVIGEIFHLAPTLYAALRWPGPPPFTAHLFNLGELLAVLAPVGLWWVWGRHASRSAWLGGALPALAFAGAYLSAPAMTATLVIWSVGFTLYLPWVLYAASLWLSGITVIAAAQRGNTVGWGLLLLASGGFVPQFSVQIFLGLMGAWLLIAACRRPVPPLVRADTTASRHTPVLAASTLGRE